MSWRETALSDLAQIESGGGAPQDAAAFSTAGLPFFRAGSLPKLLSGMSEDELEHIRPEVARQHGLREFPMGTLLFAKSGMSATKGHIYRMGRPGYVVNHLAALIPRNDDAGRFLVHALRFRSPMALIKDAAYPSIRLGDIANFTIPAPLSLDEQRRIAAILDKADGLRQKRERAIALLDCLTQSIFLEIFGDPIANVAGLLTVPLKALVDPQRGITYGIVQRGPDQESGVPVVRISDFKDGRLLNDDLRRTTPEISGQYARTILRGGEIVISIRGTVGRCASVPMSMAGANVSREVAVIPTKDPTRNPFHISLLRSGPVQRAIVADVKGVAQSGINLEDLRELPVIQPPDEQLRRFLAASSNLDRRLQEALAASGETERLFSSLQQRAFSGELERE